MIDIISWDNNISKGVTYNGTILPIKLNNVIQVGASDLLEFSIGSKAFRISHPHINDDNTLLINGTSYVAVYKVLKPIITNIGIGRKKRVTIVPTYSDAISMFVTRKAKWVSCSYGRNFFYKSIPEEKMGVFNTFPIRKCDRLWINNISGYAGDETYVTNSDILFCYSLFSKQEEWNWKHIDNLRLMTIEDSYLSFLSTRMYMIMHNTDNAGVQRISDKFWFGNPQIQWLDPNNSAIAKLALSRKVHYPIDIFDPIDDAIPDPSSVGWLDFLSTPQSSKAGSILSLCDNVSIVNGKFVLIK